MTLEQAAVRQKELDFYTNNYWIWGGGWFGVGVEWDPILSHEA